jgi:predicted DNA-binding transcriptional regulator YafY
MSAKEKVQCLQQVSFDDSPSTLEKRADETIKPWGLVCSYVSNDCS